MIPTHGLLDAHGRVMRDLRVSVTDRCNLRCLYCLPETEAATRFFRDQWAAQSVASPPPFQAPRLPPWQPRQNILSFEEIERVVRVAVQLGIRKIRLTGGEPLLRREIEKLVARLSRIDGVRDLAMTSNGVFFAQKGRALREAGLQRISFSLDSLDRENFRNVTGRDGLNEVLASIAQARTLGFHPIKLNTVIIRGLNDHEIPALAEFACARGLSIRFIEFMPLDSARVWLKHLVVTGREILQRLQARFALQPAPCQDPSETAQRWRVAGQTAEIGIIASVTEPFCGHCNRLRLTADGKIRTCLFSITEHDLRQLLRGSACDGAIADFLQAVVQQKELGHRIGQADFAPPERSMSCIGG